MGKKISQWKRHKDNIQKVSEWVEPQFVLKEENEVDPALKHYVAAIGKAIRGVKFLRRSADTYWVYMDNNPYVMGWVGRSLNFLATTTSQEPIYAVVSRCIENWKYGDYSWQHYCKMTTIPHTAIKNAKKYLRPMTPQDMAYVHDDDIKQAMEGSTRKQREELGSAYKKVFDIDPWKYLSAKEKADYKDMTVLKAIRYLYANKEEHPLFGEDVDFVKECENFFAQEKKYEDMLNIQNKVWYIRVYEDSLKKQSFEITFIGVAKGGKLPNHNAVGELGLSPKYQYTDKDIPKEFMGKVSVLTMLEKGGFVDEVGYKLDTTMFYVITEKDYHITSDTTR
tara:strand:+ start:240 stop:1250 length:1011 start_codon:yes stop_codon:yes gene_type:complete